MPLNFFKSDEKKCGACLAVIFIISRLCYMLAGISFNFYYINYLNHFMDPELLKNRLIETIYYMHCQPPLFNFYIGLGLKAGDDVIQNAYFSMSFLVCGALLFWFLYDLMLKFNINYKIAFFVTAFFMISPAAILYENWLFYTYPVTMFLVFSAYCLFNSIQKKNGRYMALFFITLAAIVLIRSMFHIAWFIFITAGLAFALRKTDLNLAKKTLACAFIPFIIIFSFYAKNYYQFNSFSLSSWFGMNFAKMAIFSLTPAQRIEAVQGKKVSPLFLQSPFSPLDSYEIDLAKIPLTNIPVLDQLTDSNGKNNFNNIAYLEISRKYLSDSLNAIKEYPYSYINGVTRSFFFYFVPASEYPLLYDNSNSIKGFIELFEKVFYLRFKHDDWNKLYYNYAWNFKKSEMLSNVSYTLLIICPVLFIMGIYRLFLWLKRSGSTLSNDENTELSLKITFAYIIFNIFYVTLAGNLVEIGENNRFRFMIDPFYLILFGYFIDGFLKKYRKSSV